MLQFFIFLIEFIDVEIHIENICFFILRISNSVTDFKTGYLLLIILMLMNIIFIFMIRAQHYNLQSQRLLIVVTAIRHCIILLDTQCSLHFSFHVSPVLINLSSLCFCLRASNPHAFLNAVFILGILIVVHFIVWVHACWVLSKFLNWFFQCVCEIYLLVNFKKLIFGYWFIWRALTNKFENGKFILQWLRSFVPWLLPLRFFISCYLRTVYLVNIFLFVH